MTSLASLVTSDGISISILPRQLDGRRRHGHQSFGAAGEAELLAGRRLHRHPACRNSAGVSNGGFHRRDMRPNPWRLTNDGQVEVDHPPAALSNQARRMLEENARPCA